MPYTGLVRPHRLLATALLLSQAAAVYAASAQTPLDPASLKLLPVRMREFTDRNEISGIVTLVARNGQIAALDPTGFADIENGKPMRTGAIVQIMSQTKTVTGVAALILVDEGRLDLTRPVQDYLLNPGAFGHRGAFGTSGMVDPKNGLVMVFLPQMVGGPAKQAQDIFTQLAESAVRR